MQINMDFLNRDWGGGQRVNNFLKMYVPLVLVRKVQPQNWHATS